MSSEHPFGQPAELAALYVTGAMTPEEQRRFEEHLATGCAICTTALQRLASVAQALAPAEAVTDLSTRIEMAKIGGSLSKEMGHSIRVVRAKESEWQATPFAGITMRVLHVDRARGEYTALIRMNPNSVCPEHRYDNRSQCLIVEGDLFVGEHHLQPGDFAFSGAGRVQDARAGEHGCLAYVIEPIN